jgi:hypothetical protein
MRTMSEMFDEVVAICLDRLTDGDSIDQCVADYPECADLRETLEVAELLMAQSMLRAEPRWLRSSRFRVVTGFGLRSLRPTG